MHVLDHLTARGFLEQCTDLDGLRARMDEGPVTFYVGFDPTADTLHLGNLVPVMGMAWLQRAGHKAILVLGGGTGMVGDPSGKTSARELLTADKVRHNLECQRPQFARFLDLDQALVLDNAEWLLPLKYVDFLRDIGRHFSINHMLSAEGVKQRLERNQGLSFIEFNYHLLQSYDFLVLNQEHGCELQFGGNDQWFHICGGADLIRRVEGKQAWGLTFPLIMTSDGKKMGKSEKGALFLDADRVSPYDYFQHLLNVSDADVIKFLKLFTFLPLERIEELAQLQGADIREAKRVLALEATALAHGRDEAEKADEAARKAFSGGVSDDMPTFATSLPCPVVDALVDSGLCSSKGDARRMIQGGGVRLGDDKVSDINALIGGEAVLWKGKKNAVRVIAG